jgi:RNA polymerase sigma-70 factor (ECF subfamily)
MVDERSLLDAWRDGDRAAGGQLFELHFQTVFRFFRTKFNGPIDDLVQQTFVACLEGKQRVVGDHGLRPYLLGCARYVLISAYKQRHRMEEDAVVSSSVAALDPSPSWVAAKREEQALLLQALRQLSVEQQIVLELYYLEGMRGPALAEALDVPEGTVRSRLKRGLERLRQEVERLANTPNLADSTLHGLEAWAGEVRGLLVAE